MLFQAVQTWLLSTSKDSQSDEKRSHSAHSGHSAGSSSSAEEQADRIPIKYLEEICWKRLAGLELELNGEVLNAHINVEHISEVPELVLINDDEKLTHFLMLKFVLSLVQNKLVDMMTEGDYRRSSDILQQEMHSLLQKLCDNAKCKKSTADAYQAMLLSAEFTINIEDIGKRVVDESAQSVKKTLTGTMEKASKTNFELLENLSLLNRQAGSQKQSLNIQKKGGKMARGESSTDRGKEKILWKDPVQKTSGTQKGKGKGKAKSASSKKKTAFEYFEDRQLEFGFPKEEEAVKERDEVGRKEKQVDIDEKARRRTKSDREKSTKETAELLKPKIQSKITNDQEDEKSFIFSIFYTAFYLLVIVLDIYAVHEI